eukprot:c16719_g1_i2 orf=702-3128(-)
MGRAAFISTLTHLLSQLWHRLIASNPLLPFLVPVFLILWFLERSFSDSSNWVPLLFTVWVTIKYGRHQRKVLIEEMNNKRKWHMQNTQPLTPLEPCEWLNKLLINLWPNYMEPKLSHRFAAMMMKKIKAIKPIFIENVELQEFSLGLAPPALGIECTYWRTEGDEQVLHTGFHWDTNEMSILLAITFVGPIKKRVHVVVNNLHMKGDLRVVPILDGHCVLYSFESPPEVRIGATIGGDSDPSSMIEIPGIPFLLERIMLAILAKTMVEPQRRCFSFPAVNLQKHVSGAIISVTIVSGNNLGANRSSSNKLYKSSSSSRNKDDIYVIENNKRKFVEVRLDNVTRKTKGCQSGGLSPIWDETFDLILDGSTGSIYVTVFEQSSDHVKLCCLGRCKVKVKYIQDDSTVFWAIGRNNSSVAVSAKHPGDLVEMTIPLEGEDFAEISLRLVVKQWHYTDDHRSDISHGILGSLSSFQASTGRTIKIIVEEGRNLVAKDKFENSDPYILVQYGKTVRKTKTVPRNLNPSWNQTFEFAEISGGEYLKLKCFDADLVMDDNLGSARVNLEGLEDDECRELWVPLENMDTGEVRLTIKAIRAQSKLNKSEATTPAGGTLELVLLEARDLVAADLCGTSDPFVSVHYGKQKKRTKVIYKNLNPQWNQTLEFPDDGKSLELYVKDHNTLLPTSNIGHCIVDYKSLSLNQTLDEWIPLQGVRRGKVHIQLTRRLHMAYKKPSNPTVNINTLLSITSSKISSLLKEALQLAEEGDMEQLCEKVAEMELLESEQDAQISQIFREKEMLLSKTSELERAMENT